MRIFRRYVVDAVVAIGMLALITTAVGITARAGSSSRCVAYTCSSDSDCNSGCPGCLFTVDDATGQCPGSIVGW